MRNADPEAVNIAELAARFGFAPLGRFAAEYRAAFGQTRRLLFNVIQGRDPPLHKICYFCIAAAEIDGLTSCNGQALLVGINQFGCLFGARPDENDC